MIGVLLLLALSTTLPLQVTAPERIAPLVPAQHFQPVIVPFEYFNRHIFVRLSVNREFAARSVSPSSVRPAQKPDHLRGAPAEKHPGK